MPKNIVIAVFGSLLILCVAAQVFSTNRVNMPKSTFSQYSKIH